MRLFRRISLQDQWFREVDGDGGGGEVLAEGHNGTEEPGGVEDILIACVDGLKGFPEALDAVLPKTVVQTCTALLIRASLRFVPWKDRKVVASWLRDIHQADTEAAAEDAVDTFELEWGGRYPMTVQCWRRAWAPAIPFLTFPKEIRRTLYTTNCHTLGYWMRAESAKRMQARSPMQMQPASPKRIHDPRQVH